MTTTIPRLPRFDDLPLDPSHPPHSAWGVWGMSDQLGCLNHLTPERIVAASKTIQTGVSVGLSWSMGQMSVPPFYRTKLKHEIFSIAENANDDKLEFNTQTSSQWDGFRHWSYPSSEGKLYNGVTHDEVRNTDSTRNGIHVWTKKGIVGRGVLIDYYSYALENGLDYDPWTYHQIPVSTMEEIARQKRISFQPGDILLLRTGFLQVYQTMPLEQLERVMGRSSYTYPGLEGSVSSLRWLWNTHFAAVAADSPAFEAWSSGLGQSDEHFRLHEYILSGFGLPIGELFDLEALSEECKKHNRWTFFVSSQPLNVLGGVGSPPNALAIF